MNALRIYRVTDHYIAFLHSRDSRVQFNKQTSRPYVGVVLHVGEFKYFVPMESPKPHHNREDICRALHRYVDEYKWGWGVARRQLKFRFGVDYPITELKSLYKQVKVTGIGAVKQR